MRWPLRRLRNRPVRRTRPCLGVERLETREVPATLVNPTTVTYQDVDGDDVTVKFSKAVLTAGNVNTILKFATGDVNSSNAAKQQLQKIDLTAVPASAGTSVTLTALASKLHGGDGFAALGELKANGLDLGMVNIDGDLGRVLAGDADTKTTGLVSLSAQSIGRFGTTTGAMNLHTVIQGKLGTLNVKGDVNQSFVWVTGFDDGQIGSVTIGGSLVGGSGQFSGEISADGAIGSVTIKGDIVGGAAVGGGSILGKKIGSVTIGGSLRGAGGESSGVITSNESIGPVSIGGSVFGGSGNISGTISAPFLRAPVSIGGSLTGGAGFHSGRVNSILMGAVRVGGDVIGGAGEGSGGIDSQTKMGDVTIGGSLLGGAGKDSARVHSLGKIASVKVGGSLIGGAGTNSAVIENGDDLGPVRIAGGISGGDGVYSGRVDSAGKIASVSVGGSVIGEAGFSGQIKSSGEVGSIRIGGNLLGAGYGSGTIQTNGKVTSLFIGGSIKGGFESFTGHVAVVGELTTMTIGGDLVGGTAADVLNDYKASGYVEASRIGTLTIGGSLIAPAKNNQAAFEYVGTVRVTTEIRSLVIKGNLVGDPTNPAVISARGQTVPTATSDVAIGSLRVNGRVEHALIRSGYNKTGHAINADAQVGTITVGGDWIASTVLSGIMDANFNVKDAAAVHSKIGSLTIGGQMLGTTGGGDLFIVKSNELGSLRVGGTVIKLTAGILNDAFAFGPTGDFVVVEGA